MKQQLSRFLIVGGLTVLVDLLSYHALMRLGVPLSPAKAMSFMLGTLFAYWMNKSWTFQASGGARVFIKFGSWYIATLGVNVWVNASMLKALGPEEPASLAMAFLSATALSATLNFLGMRFLIFKEAGH